jgi:hypothetical protein
VAAAAKEASMWKAKYQEGRDELMNLRARWEGERGGAEEAMLMLVKPEAETLISRP